MTITRKTIWTLVAIIVPLGIIISAFFWGKNIWQRLKFKPYFVSADLSGLSVSDIQSIFSGGQRVLTATLGLIAINDSGTSVSFSGLKAKLFYDNTLLAETSDSLKEQKHTATAHNMDNPLKVEDPVNIILSQAVVKLATDKLAGRNPQIEYTIALNIYGVPITKIFPIKGTFPLGKKA